VRCHLLVETNASVVALRDDALSNGEQAAAATTDPALQRKDRWTRIRSREAPDRLYRMSSASFWRPDTQARSSCVV
jgi:hypothetical protein